MSPTTRVAPLCSARTEKRMRRSSERAAQFSLTPSPHGPFPAVEPIGTLRSSPAAAGVSLWTGGAGRRGGPGWGGSDGSGPACCWSLSARCCRSPPPGLSRPQRPSATSGRHRAVRPERNGPGRDSRHAVRSRRRAPWPSTGEPSRATPAARTSSRAAAASASPPDRQVAESSSRSAPIAPPRARDVHR